MAEPAYLKRGASRDAPATPPERESVGAAGSTPEPPTDAAAPAARQQPLPAPDFFEAQDAARRRARRWFVLFALSVAAVVAMMVLFAVFVWSWMTLAAAERSGDSRMLIGDAALLTPWWLMAGVAGLTLASIAEGSRLRRRQLATGSDAFAASIGARALGERGRAPADRQLANVVEEMALASGGLPPAVYVLDREPAVNAIAGSSAGEPFIVLTGGAVERLQRDELQALVAYATGQLRNGDALLNLRLVGWLAGLTAISDAGRTITKAPYYAATAGNDGDGEASDLRKASIFLSLPLALAGGVVMTIGYLGVLLARIMRSFASRQRVYLADATAVQYTRDPVAVRDLLRRVGTEPAGGRLTGEYREELGPLLFVPGVRRLCLRTHPTIRRRLARLERRAG